MNTDALLSIDLDAITADRSLSYNLEDFLRYATHRITDQALPTFFDGLLPGQRKLLLAMQDLGALPGRKHQKASRVVAQSTAAYHPVGNTYDVLVNMSQAFRVPVLLTDPEGNWGEPESGSAAAERYTEIRFSAFGHDTLFADLPNERTPSSRTPHNIVPTALTYTDLHWEELYLPARLPLLLLNGSNGIAVGMAQTFQPLRFDTVLAATRAVLDGTPLDNVPLHLGYPGQCAITSTPDEVRQAFMTGRGSIKVAARHEILKQGGHTVGIVITAVPPHTLYNTLGDAFAEWKRSDPLCPFSEYRNETETTTRLVFRFKHSARPTTPAALEDALYTLYRKLPLTASLTVNMTALKNRMPVAYNLGSFLTDWVDERAAIIQRLAAIKLQDLRKQLGRLHLTVWMKRRIDIVIEGVRNQTTEELLAAYLNQWFHPDNGRDVTLEEVGLILNTNLRAISRLAEEELHARIAKTEREADKQQTLVDQLPARYDVIRADLAAFEAKRTEYGLTLPDCPHDTHLAALLSPRSAAKATVTPAGEKTPVAPPASHAHALIPTFALSDTPEIVVQSRKGILTRISNRSVRTVPYAVPLLDAGDSLRTASFHTGHFLHFLTTTGRIVAIPRDKLPAATPIYPAKLAEVAKLPSDALEGALWLPLLTDQPTHLWLTFDNNTVKRVALTEFPTLRSSVSLPAPVRTAALIGPETFTALDTEGDFTLLNAAGYAEVSRTRTGHLPRLALPDTGLTPTRSENKLVLTIDATTVAKRPV